MIIKYLGLATLIMKEVVGKVGKIKVVMQSRSTSNHKQKKITIKLADNPDNCKN